MATPKRTALLLTTQRPATESGRRLLTQVEAFMHGAGIPVREIHSSSMGRARESARAAFGIGMRMAHAPNLVDPMGGRPKAGAFGVFPPEGSGRVTCLASLQAQDGPPLHESGVAP